jgi:hypothetical protein
VFRDENPFERSEQDESPDDFDPESGERRPNRRGYWPLVACLAVTGVVWVARTPWVHASRILAVLLVVALALRPLVPTVRRNDWPLACFWATVGTVLALLAWWMVPTTEGLSLWTAGQEADRHAATLETLPADDLKGFQEGHTARQRLVGQFPEFGPRLADAELAWGKGAIQAAAGEVEKVPAGEFGGYRAGRPAREALRQEFGSLRQPLDEAERAWLEGTVTAVLTATAPLLKSDPLQASRRLRQAATDVAECGDYPSAQDRLLAARKQAVAAGLNAAKRQGRALVGADRYQAAAQAANRLQEDFGDEVAAVGMTAEFGQVRQSYEFLADLARQAGKRDPR